MTTLHSTPLSANGRKVLAVRIALGLEDRIAVEEVNVYAGHGRQPAYLAIHPLGQVPALVDRGVTIWESNAILVYLAEAMGENRLWSTDPMGRAEIGRWLFWEASQWQPALTPVLAPRVGSLLNPAGTDGGSEPVDWSDLPTVRMLAFLEAHLHGRDFLCGAEPTLADFSVAGMMTYARRCDFPAEEHPEIAAWYARVEALPSWAATAAGPWA